jgi:hypothetical protein
MFYFIFRLFLRQQEAFRHHNNTRIAKIQASIDARNLSRATSKSTNKTHPVKITQCIHLFCLGEQILGFFHQFWTSYLFLMIDIVKTLQRPAHLWTHRLGDDTTASTVLFSPRLAR